MCTSSLTLLKRAADLRIPRAANTPHRPSCSSEVFYWFAYRWTCFLVYRGVEGLGGLGGSSGASGHRLCRPEATALPPSCSSTLYFEMAASNHELQCPSTSLAKMGLCCCFDSFGKNKGQRQLQARSLKERLERARGSYDDENIGPRRSTAGAAHFRPWPRLASNPKPL